MRCANCNAEAIQERAHGYDPDLGALSLLRKTKTPEAAAAHHEAGLPAYEYQYPPMTEKDFAQFVEKYNLVRRSGLFKRVSPASEAHERHCAVNITTLRLACTCKTQDMNQEEK